MTVTTNLEGEKLTVALRGRLDTLTSRDLETELESLLANPDIKVLVIDMKELEYISSAGLRVMLDAARTMEDKGEMIVTNLCSEVMDVFSITGFSEVFTIR